VSSASREERVPDSSPVRELLKDRHREHRDEHDVRANVFRQRSCRGAMQEGRGDPVYRAKNRGRAVEKAP
jgi:hypothetical protein